MVNSDKTTQSGLTELFPQSWMDGLYKYLCLEPSLPESEQPINVCQLLQDAIGTTEELQFRNILPADVTLTLSSDHFCRPDGKIFLPLGTPHAMPVVTYLNSAEEDPVAFVPTLLHDSSEPCFIWSKDWPSITGETHNQPITVTYRAGYKTFSKVPNSTLAALKVYCKAHFNPDDDKKTEDLPEAYYTHVNMNCLDHQVLVRMLTV